MDTITPAHAVPNFPATTTDNAAAAPRPYIVAALGLFQELRRPGADEGMGNVDSALCRLAIACLARAAQRAGDDVDRDLADRILRALGRLEAENELTAVGTLMERLH